MNYLLAETQFYVYCFIVPSACTFSLSTNLSSVAVNQMSVFLTMSKCMLSSLLHLTQAANLSLFLPSPTFIVVVLPPFYSVPVPFLSAHNLSSYYFSSFSTSNNLVHALEILIPLS